MTRGMCECGRRTNLRRAQCSKCAARIPSVRSSPCVDCGGQRQPGRRALRCKPCAVAINLQRTRDRWAARRPVCSRCGEKAASRTRRICRPCVAVLPPLPPGRTLRDCPPSFIRLRYVPDRVIVPDFGYITQ